MLQQETRMMDGHYEFVTVSDEATIAFRRYGTPGKPRLLLIHSLALDGSIWTDVVNGLKARAEIICIDCRGHGWSSRAPLSHAIERYADDIAEVLDKVGWDKVIVAGCSMGGCIAQAFAARHPKRVSAMTLIDTTAWYGEKAPQEWRERAQKARAQGLASMAAFQATRWFGDRFRAENPRKIQEMMEIFVRNDVDAYEATCTMLGNADLRSALSGFHFPVSVIVGEEDYATPVESARQLAKAIPGASLTILPGARHLTPIECSDVIADAIAKMIEAAAH
ncbi:MAG: alpha/beta hydrolase [Rhizobium sp.]